MTPQLSIAVRLVSDSASKGSALWDPCSHKYVPQHGISWDAQGLRRQGSKPLFDIVFVPCSFPLRCLQQVVSKNCKGIWSTRIPWKMLPICWNLWLKDSTVQKVVAEKKTVGPQIQVCCLHVRQPCEESWRRKLAGWFRCCPAVVHFLKMTFGKLAKSCCWRRSLEQGGEYFPCSECNSTSQVWTSPHWVFDVWKLGLINILYQFYFTLYNI